MQITNPIHFRNLQGDIFGGVTAAGIALKVGIDILDWSFLKRSHHVSMKAALIMYGVIALTVFVDLIIAVGVGVFIANILTIERLSNLRAKDVKVINDAVKTYTT